MNMPKLPAVNKRSAIFALISLAVTLVAGFSTVRNGKDAIRKPLPTENLDALGNGNGSAD